MIKELAMFFSAIFSPLITLFGIYIAYRESEKNRENAKIEVLQNLKYDNKIKNLQSLQKDISNFIFYALEINELWFVDNLYFDKVGIEYRKKIIKTLYKNIEQNFTTTINLIMLIDSDNLIDSNQELVELGWELTDKYHQLYNKLHEYIQDELFNIRLVQEQANDDSVLDDNEKNQKMIDSIKVIDDDKYLINEQIKELRNYLFEYSEKSKKYWLELVNQK